MKLGFDLQRLGALLGALNPMAAKAGEAPEAAQGQRFAALMGGVAAAEAGGESGLTPVPTPVEALPLAEGEAAAGAAAGDAEPPATAAAIDHILARPAPRGAPAVAPDRSTNLAALAQHQAPAPEEIVIVAKSEQDDDVPAAPMAEQADLNQEGATARRASRTAVPSPPLQTAVARDRVAAAEADDRAAPASEQDASDSSETPADPMEKRLPVPPGMPVGVVPLPPPPPQGVAITAGETAPASATAPVDPAARAMPVRDVLPGFAQVARQGVEDRVSAAPSPAVSQAATDIPARPGLEPSAAGGAGSGIDTKSAEPGKGATMPRTPAPTVLAAQSDDLPMPAAPPPVRGGAPREQRVTQQDAPSAARGDAAIGQAPRRGDGAAAHDHPPVILTPPPLAAPFRVTQQKDVPAAAGEATALLGMLSGAERVDSAATATQSPAGSQLPAAAMTSAALAGRPGRVVAERVGKPREAAMAPKGAPATERSALQPIYTPAVSAPMATLPLAVTVPSVAPPSVDLSAAIGQQVIDMGSGGQWIDGLAREIAALSAGSGQGSFRLSPPHLGPMRVDIMPGADGSAVTLTVETRIAETTLAKDRGALQADARLAGVGISEVRIERVASVAEPARNDNGANQGGGNTPQSQSQQAQHQQTHQHGQQAALAQGNGGQSSGNAQPVRKVVNDDAVSHGNESGTEGASAQPEARRARYA